MPQSVFGSYGQIHLENQPGSQRFDLTTGEVKTVIPTAENVSAVFGKDGVETEIQVGRCAKHWASLASIRCLISTNG